MSKNDFIYFRIMETVTPVFSRERGQRLEFMRKKLLLDQGELGQRLGVTQQMISRLERGANLVSRIPIPLSDFYKVFGCLTHHILFGLDSESHDYEQINAIYWKEKDRRKGNRTKRMRKKKRRKN